MPYLAGYVTPQDFGAVGDGVTNDTAAVQAAMNYVNATVGGGVLYCPTDYAVTPVSSTSAALTFNNGTTGFNGVRIVGGSNGTVFKKLAAGPIFAMAGPATDTTGVTHAKYCSLENLQLNGNGFSGTMIQCYYADNLFFDNVHCTSNADVVFDTAEFWDSRFYNLVVEACGSQTSNASTPNMLLRNSAAASGFGASTDNVNQIHFVGCRWEAFHTGAVWIQQGVSNSNNPNGIFFVNCKMETSSINGGPHMLVDSNSKGIYVKNLYCYSGGFNGAYSTAQDVVTWSPQDSSLENVFIATGATQTVANGVTLNSTVANQTVSARNVTAIYNGLPTGQHVAYGTATGNFVIDNCTSNQTPPTTLNAAVNYNENASSNAIVAGLVGGDTFKRYQLNANGTMLFGPGNAAADNQFNRATSTTMSFSKNLQIGGSSALGDNGVGELQFTNATTVPTTSPTGGVSMYSSAGVVNTRNPQGLVQIQGGPVQVQTSTVTVANTATITALQSFTVPANDAVAGAVYKLTGYGVFSDNGTPTLTFTLLWGGTGGTAVASMPAITMPNGLTNSPFFYEGYLTFRSTTTVWASFRVQIDQSTSTNLANNYIVSPSTVTTVTTTGTNALVLAVTWGTGAAANTISLVGGLVERLA